MAFAFVFAFGGCGGESALEASFDYEMPARFTVPALVALEDQTEYEAYVEGPLQPERWRVRFDACGSTGSPARYIWRIDGDEVAVETRCDGFETEFPVEGEYSVSLTVEDGSGAQEEQAQVIEVRDLLIFALGDSYGSGEGSPDVDEREEGGARWQNRECHRSSRSGRCAQRR